MEIDEKALNEKLAKWARVKYCRYWGQPGHDDRFCDEPIPNFTQSLDTCFKWLVPKLQYEIVDPIVVEMHLKVKLLRIHFICTIHSERLSRKDKLIGKASAEGPALALCLAIEQLIDSEEKENV